MQTFFSVRHAASPKEIERMNTSELRNNFLIEKIFEPDSIHLTLTYYDRFIAGGIMPVTEIISLPNPDALKASYFLERREMGIINVGGKGKIIVHDTEYVLEKKEALYIGKGIEDVQFISDDENDPAKFYINSAPAHHSYPTKKISSSESHKSEVGSVETANHRVINKFIVNTVVSVCQLQMGMTELKPSSVWNTMPAHTHDRRMEVYFYFDVPSENSVCHFMGLPDETKHMWIQNEQAVISPNWSIHSGAGTSNYSFVWGMAGENLDYGDMDIVKINQLK
ncbi:MAG TPA: 5-dehydro-4-deoxy-D-glucuronate isomerase [Puia sp.]|jgi:4-deoxy-L-threo-5-hexosulose-uronate ketol-isomerase|nr:5-dehydro-4-deoxy-D-glucuronate isomerase [Puia sp.]